MKKLMLTNLQYRWPDRPSDSEPVSRQLLVVINSSRAADDNHDTEAAVSGCKAWFEKSVMAEQGATYVSITAEPTIDAENPGPPVMYTEGDLVSFGNWMAAKVLNLLNAVLTPEQQQLAPVLDSDIQNWKNRATA